MARGPEYPFVITPLERADGGGYLIEFPDLPGCVSDGETPEKAIASGRAAVRAWIAAAKAHRDPVPPPSARATYSGKWQIRMARSLHHRLAERAKAEGVSLNVFATTILAEALGRPARSRQDRKIWRAGESSREGAPTGATRA
jgi:antitoxin HicB